MQKPLSYKYTALFLYPSVCCKIMCICVCVQGCVCACVTLALCNESFYRNSSQQCNLWHGCRTAFYSFSLLMQSQFSPTITALPVFKCTVFLEKVGSQSIIQALVVQHMFPTTNCVWGMLLQLLCLRHNSVFYFEYIFRGVFFLFLSVFFPYSIKLACSPRNGLFCGHESQISGFQKTFS